MEEQNILEKNFVHLARVALSERTQDVQAFLHRVAKQKDTRSELSFALIDLLRQNPTRASPLRRDHAVALPTDADSRFELLRVELEPQLPTQPIYAESIQETLDGLIQERENIECLYKAGLEPTSTVLLTGPPGVGKTLAARWLARELGLPLLILDLSAVMSSYLGRTGSNLRLVLDYAKSNDCVLLLDELDAIAKRRDDDVEIGELKRLVTVLLQQLDDWPSSGILIAATNHSGLLDPAVWRRFELLIEFPLPDQESVQAFLKNAFAEVPPSSSKWIEALSMCLAGRSFGEIEHYVARARRAAVLSGRHLDQHLVNSIGVEGFSKKRKIKFAVFLVQHGLATQRAAHKLTGVARDTIRAHLKAV